MPSETVQALVIDTAPYGETSLLMRLLTREAGVVRALAKGARRPRATASPAAFEPCAWIEAALTRRKEDGLATLAACEARQQWPWLRSDLARLAYAALGLEVLTALAACSPREPFFFDEGARYLTALESAEGPGALAAALLLRLLHHAGFPPRLDAGLTLLRGEGRLPQRLTYHFDEGVFAAAQPADSMRDQRLALEVIAPFLGLEPGAPDCLAAPPSLESPPRLGARLGPAALRWLIHVWQDHLQTEFRSAAFLEKMVLKKK